MKMKRMNNLKNKVKLTVSLKISIIVFLVMTVMVTVLLSSKRHSTTDAVKEIHQTGAEGEIKIIAEYIDSELKSIHSLITMLATDIDGTDIEQGTVMRKLKAAQSTYNTLEAVYFAGKVGKLQIYPAITVPDDFDPTQREKKIISTL